MRGATAAWHDVECASYAADLELWRELAAAATPAPVLDLGAGTGRVALDLAERGHEMTAVDSDPELVAELSRRARQRGLRVDCVPGDARTLALGRRFGFAFAAMQVVQLLGGTEGRRALFARVAEHLEPGARFAAALADPFEAVPPEHSLPPLPDVAEVEGWVLSSRPVDVRAEAGGVAVHRLRQLVSPTGDLSEELHTIVLESVTPDELEAEASAAGLIPAGRRQVPATAEYVGSTVVIVEAPPVSGVLRVCALYPELMNIYADRGNIAVLRARCEWRGIGFEVASATLGEPVAPEAHDLYYLGGGQDRDQIAVAADMVATKRDALHAAADRGAVVLAVCGGYQLLGHSYQLGEEELPGVGLVDLRTVREPGPRLIGNSAIEADLGDGPRVIAGFENHGGRTYLGEGERPLGRVLAGHGNNDSDGFEGVHRGNVIGTYLHGPLLPKNVWLADRLIELALDVRLDPLPGDEVEDAAHAGALRAAGV